mmetsp:Transcript_107635/g.273295  ORF Transcript_107635/g.273295 Transcript_107635/m.273295 type:complete len:200 (+) Transcript_107635:864-1463(+)
MVSSSPFFTAVRARTTRSRPSKLCEQLGSSLWLKAEAWRYKPRPISRNSSFVMQMAFTAMTASSRAAPNASGGCTAPSPRPLRTTPAHSSPMPMNSPRRDSLNECQWSSRPSHGMGPSVPWSQTPRHIARAASRRDAGRSENRRPDGIASQARTSHARYSAFACCRFFVDTKRSPVAGQRSNSAPPPSPSAAAKDQSQR